MSIFQLLMLGASAFFAFKIYEHIQTLQDPKESNNDTYAVDEEEKTADTFSPFSPEALLEKADTAYEEGDNQKALALLHEANAKDANNEEILFKIAYIFQKSGDNEEALKYYKDALSLDKKNEVIHNALASLFRARGEFTSAKIHIKASLDIDSENPVTYYNYGNLLVDTENKEEAKEMYTKALELNPDFDEARVELDKLNEE
ncbi:MAG: tetratricopeptide (TPR) repeat protein [Sulfurimonas sp.]|jgi:tetratricopeptide (TPR) repeat protein|uniref:tetratricopeptide repeat protein n=1 Tax=Sulfurimonas sp. TaxID=2022749 RepID=UPI0039E50253